MDGLRGIAVLVVMLYHAALLLPSMTMFVKGGFLGVDIFFVLSGFLITSILLTEHQKTGTIDLKNFYIRRTLRLIPAFWLFLIVLYSFGEVLLDSTAATVIYSNNNFAYSFFYLMNWHSAVGYSAGNLNHTWSLAIEEQFYIIWSLALFQLFGTKLTRRHIVFTVAAVIVFLIVQRGIRAAFGADTNILYYSTDTRIDALLIGCVASMLYCWRIVSDSFFRSAIFGRMTYVSLIIAVSILFVFSFADRSLYYGAISLFSASIAVMILWLVTREGTAVHKAFEFSALRWIGQISYGLYLWHYVFFEFARKTVDSVTVQVVIGVGLAFGVSAVSFYVLEKPILGLKGRLTAPRPPALAGQKAS